MSDQDLKDVLIASLLVFIFLFMFTGCTSIEVIHREGRMPKVEMKSEFFDKLCTKDFDAEVKTDQFIISCEIAI